MDIDPTPGFPGIKNSFDPMQSMLTSLYKDKLRTYNQQRQWHAQANYQMFTTCIDLARRAKANDVGVENDEDTGYVSSQPIALVLHSHNTCQTTMQARLKSRETFKMIASMVVDFNTLSDEELYKLQIYTYNASSEAMVRSATLRARDRQQKKFFSNESRQAKIEAILALQDSAAMYSYDRPDEYTEEFEQLNTEYAPVDFHARYVQA